MICKLAFKKILKIHKSCSKFVFLTKKFKEKKNITLLKLFLNAMIKNIKMHNNFLYYLYFKFYGT